jgi:hypothetical protein
MLLCQLHSPSLYIPKQVMEPSSVPQVHSNADGGATKGLACEAEIKPNIYFWISFFPIGI